MILGRKPLGTVGFLGGVWAVPTQFCWSWGQMIQYNEEFIADNMGYIHYDYIPYSDHAPARNALAERFIGDWLLQLDTDHEFEPDIVHRLLRLMKNSDVKVVCGLYRYKDVPYTPVYHVRNEKTETMQAIAAFKDPIPDLLEVSGGGAGCLLVHRDVFVEIEEKLNERPFDRIDQCSEDQSFFQRLRKLKIKAYLAPKIDAWHLRASRVTAEDAIVDSIGKVNKQIVGGFSG